MKKPFQFTLIALFLFVTLPATFLFLGINSAKAGDDLQKWRSQHEKIQGLDDHYKQDAGAKGDSFQEVEQESIPDGSLDTIDFIGEVRHYTFSDCCDHYLDVVLQSISNIDDSANVSFIEYDFNDDVFPDFISRIDSESVCEESFCPTHLFIRTGDSYRKFDGPSIRGNRLAVSESKNNQLHDLVFKMKNPGWCVWKIAQGPDQNLECFVGNSIQDPDRKKQGNDKTEQTFNKIIINTLQPNELKDIYSFLSLPERNAKVGVSMFSGFQGKDQFLLVYYEGRFHCGTHGCSTYIYQIEGGHLDGKLLARLNVKRPIYKKVCNKKMALVFSPGGGAKSGFSEWVYEDGDFKFRKKYSSLSQASKCN